MLKLWEFSSSTPLEEKKCLKTHFISRELASLDDHNADTQSLAKIASNVSHLSIRETVEHYHQTSSLNIKTPPGNSTFITATHVAIFRNI